jgi:hypothetical protein
MSASYFESIKPELMRRIAEQTPEERARTDIWLSGYLAGRIHGERRQDQLIDELRAEIDDLLDILRGRLDDAT